MFESVRRHRLSRLLTPDDLGRVADWIHIQPPISSDLASVIIEKILRDQIRPSLRSADFIERSAEELSDFVKRMVTIHQLHEDIPQPDRARLDPAAWCEQLTEMAHAFGGETWADAIFDSLSSVERAGRARIRLSQHTLTDEQLRVLDQSMGAIVWWAWGMYCFLALHHEPDVASSLVQNQVRQLLVDASEAAYALLREMELTLEAARMDGTEPLPFPGAALTPEAQTLEEDAQQESQRILHRLGL